VFSRHALVLLPSILYFFVLFLHLYHLLAPNPTIAWTRCFGLHNLIPHVLWNTEVPHPIALCRTNISPRPPSIPNLISRMRAHYNIDLVNLTSPAPLRLLYHFNILQLLLKGLANPNQNDCIIYVNTIQFKHVEFY